jgi:hypothetical protein
MTRCSFLLVVTGLVVTLSPFCAQAQTRDVHAVRQAPSALTESEAWKFFSCKTFMSFMPGHGTQISYRRPDGAIFLWYPGNTIVLSGRWKIVMRATSSLPPVSTDICFLYETNTYNPVTKRPGGDWQCMPADLLARFTVERADGDIFGLAVRRAVPFILPSEKSTIADLRTRIRLLDASKSQFEGSSDDECEKEKKSPVS